MTIPQFLLNIFFKPSIKKLLSNPDRVQDPVRVDNKNI